MTGCNRGQDGVRIVFFYRKYEQNLFTKKKKKKKVTLGRNKMNHASNAFTVAEEIFVESKSPLGCLTG